MSSHNIHNSSKGKDGNGKSGKSSKKEKDNKSAELPSRVAQMYYKHGLFLTSYPTCASSLALMVVLFCCYPLLNIPLPGTIPTKVTLPYSVISSPLTSPTFSTSNVPLAQSTNADDLYIHDSNINSKKSDSSALHEDPSNPELNDLNKKSTSDTKESKSNKNFLNIDTNQLYRLYNNITSTSSLLMADPPFPWARIDPYIYIQQIILKSIVLPWNKKLQLTDAFRGPLFEVFKLLEIINNHEDAHKMTLSNFCLHVENVKRPNNQVLFPEYNCLVLSPANLWKQNIHNFNKDTSLLSTIFSQHNFQKTKVSTAEMLFGIPMSDTGIKRYPMRIRPRTIQFAITIMLRENNPEYLSSLEKRLHQLYPLHQKHLYSNDERKLHKLSVVYIYYPGEFNINEFVPLCCAYVMLFMYIYFSIRKVDMIRSRLVLAISSVVTVIGSLVMSLGMCFFFGLTISMQSKGIYPYLVILVGLENCLVLTKSVMTTDNNLDVKIRVAQGLSKEGWSITKNLLTEITILTIGLATFVPVIQEFCIFAIVGLLSDYFLQMLLFSTVLGLNIKRVEYMTEVKQLPKLYTNICTFNHNNAGKFKANDSRKYPITNNVVINRSKSHPSKLASLDTTDITVTASANTQKNNEKKIPKRLRIVHFWARTRIFQRGFMIWMVLWISNIIYNSGIIENAFFIDKYNTSKPNGMASSNGDLGLKNDDLINYENIIKNISNIMSDYQAPKNLHSSMKEDDMTFNITEMLQKIRHPDYEINSKLSNFHWSSILKQYNISLSSRYITILPSIKLSHIVPYEVALKIRNPNERPPSTSKWKALASALDPLEFNDVDAEESPNINLGNRPLYPKTPMEILLTAILASISIVVLAYTMVVMYRCICSRNYAEWRASWNDSDRVETKSERVLEGFPIQVNGHTHNIECIVTDGNLIASSCLQGQLKIWDATNGDLVAEIDRVKYFEEMKQYYGDRQLIHTSDDSLSGGSKQRTAVRDKFEVQSPNSQIRLRNLIKFDFQNPYSNSSHDVDLNGDQKRTVHDDFQSSYEKYFPHHATTPTSPININSSTHSLISDTDNEHIVNGFHELSPSQTSTNSKLTVQRSNSLHNDNLDKYYASSPIWSLDFIDNLIVIGCADGRLEFWEGTTGNFKCIYETESTRNNGVTHIKLSGDRVIAARLSGRIDFLRLETYTQGRQIDWNFTSAYRRAHVRTGSAGSIGSIFNQSKNPQRNPGQLSSSPTAATSGSSTGDTKPTNLPQEELRCILESQQQGHQQPVTCLDVLGNIVFSGSQDHTLKVHHLESNSLLFTLHGHCGPITSLFIDQWQSGTGCSGSQDGLLCVWDLITGACMYNLQAHDDSIVSMACAPSYIISLGLDERLRVWERFQGHLLNTINVIHAYSNLLMLTPSLLVTGKPGSLLVWDVRTGEPAHEVRLDGSNQQLCPKIMLPSYGSVICDFGNQLRIVRFPLVTTDKCE